MNGIDEYRNKIICGDNIPVMSKLPDDCIDLTVTSPPYGNLRDYKGYVFDFEGTAKQLFRITKPGGVVVWIVGDETVKGSETGTSFRQALYFMDIGFRLHDTMIYWKNQFAFPEQNRYAQNFEYMFVLSKGSPSATNIIKVPTKEENRIKNKGGCYRIKDGRTVPLKYETGKDERNKENIWAYEVGYMKSAKDDYVFKHPAIFPEKLVGDHIISWSNPGDLILDPMCGSGTSCKMAKELDRDFIGIEISPEYCAIAEKRIAFIDYYGKPTEVLGSTPPINFMEMKGKDG